jgi:hypothetical protein
VYPQSDAQGNVIHVLGEKTEMLNVIHSFERRGAEAFFVLDKS